MNPQSQNRKDQPIEFIRWPQLLLEVSLGENTIRDMIMEGSFPQSVKLGPRAVGFLRREIEDWKNDRLAERELESQKQRALPITRN